MTAPEEIVRLYKTYCGKDRHYHNINHIWDLFAEFNECLDLNLVENHMAMRYAIWYHDFVYDTYRTDNEEQSAEVAYTSVLNMGHSEVIASIAKRLVLVTKHKFYVPETNDEQLICDMDLSALAAETEHFEKNNKLIRLEYAHVPDVVFHSAHKAILKAFLDRPHIYYTDHFRSKYETKAKKNLSIATA